MKFAVQFPCKIKANVRTSPKPNLTLMVDLFKWYVAPACEDTNPFQSRKHVIPDAEPSCRSNSENTPYESRAPRHRPSPPYKHASHMSDTCQLMMGTSGALSWAEGQKRNWWNHDSRYKLELMSHTSLYLKLIHWMLITFNHDSPVQYSPHIFFYYLIFCLVETEVGNTCGKRDNVRHNIRNTQLYKCSCQNYFDIFWDFEWSQRWWWLYDTLCLGTFSETQSPFCLLVNIQPSGKHR